MHVPSPFVLVVYFSGYVFLVFAAICLACGLYYLAELAEENTSLAKKCLQWACLGQVGIQVLLLVFERFPLGPVFTSVAAHGIYLGLLHRFPFIEPKSVPFIAACALFAGSNVAWFRFFTSTSEFFYQYRLSPPAAIASFFFLTIWIVPLGLFVSLTINDSVLPGAGIDAPRSGNLSGDGKRKRTNLVSSVMKIGSHYGGLAWSQITGKKPRTDLGSLGGHDHDW
eukprot:Plantae.Rhodophyta-Rhodochaete_pulchella.ctg2280.p1 GENE.Plantae.Rhodophyta-Rhodochaete_pulchella.ctg2280~~Plantae.Rhodophyta-Rhodochaete_pulchella.ctg2280.p1  ORF type:complete len:240 (-),score=29.86 Plantae.Rhodophyta-Rhodochaete_pulchella.ctg2280:609-1283(-)